MKKRLQGFIAGILVCSMFLSIPVLSAGVNKTIKAVFNSVTVKIDGKAVSGDKISYNKNVYVNAKSVADYLGKTYVVDKSGNVTIATKTQPIQTGGIKGSVTWQYNKSIGTKADTNAKVALIPKNLIKGTYTDFSTLLYASKQLNKLGVYSTKANGYGNYEINNIPVGKYYILIISSNTYSHMTIDDWDKERLEKIFSEEDYNRLESSMKINKYELDEIEITKNQTLDYSKDFGFSYI